VDGKMNVTLVQDNHDRTDYTGRWMISRYNDEYYLYIECFNLKDIAVYETRKFLCFEWKHKVGTKLWCFTRWVDADNLNVIVTDEHINECACNPNS